MKFPLSLLKRFLITDAPLDVIAATATAIGLEVDGIDNPTEALGAFVVAEILEAVPHPQADKLRVCKVNAAQGELQIVCGAPNARAGIKVALANIGSIIPTNGMEIKKSAIRGVESQGMLCSARELGIGEDSDGIMELPANAAIGTPIVDILGLNDPVLDLNITANRGDCMGVYGVARDLAAAGIGTLKPLCFAALSESGACPITVTIEDAQGCPAFIGRVIRGVKNGASPEWLQRTLTAAGMRPISTLVDITNYFTLAFGRPLHVYDLAKLTSNLTVRRAVEGETFTALNDKTYFLTPQDCVIADDSGALGLGGIMGGASTGVSESTTDILLEIALFDPIRIAMSGRAHQLTTDARARFERGVDAGFMEHADIRATELILELCGGTPTARVLAGTIPTKTPEIAFDAAQVNALCGTDIPENRMREILTALGFRDHGLHMHAPTWRHDVSQPADLAEEVLRIVGYDTLPMVSLPKPVGVSRPAITPTQQRHAQARRVLAARGLHETYGWGFCSAAEADAFGGQSEALELLNPISADLSVMRPNLLPHLLTGLRQNHARGQADVALFELGAVFRDVTPTGQASIAAGVRMGLRHGLHWESSPKADLFDVKADALAVLEAAGLDTAKLQISRTAPGYYHPGRSGVLSLGPKNMLAYFGELHPTTLKTLGLDFPVFAFEVMLEAIPAPKTAKHKALSVSDFQPVTRDFAFVMDAATPVADLVKAVNAAEKTLLRELTLFDVYTGKGVAEGKKSIALSVRLQADDRTLTDADTQKIADSIITSARRIGAELR